MAIRKQHSRRSDCHGDNEAVARRKQHNRRSDCVRTVEFLENLQKKVLEDPGNGIRDLSRELNVSASTVKLVLNEDLRYHSHKHRRGQLLTENASDNRLTKGKKHQSKVKHPTEPQKIWFFFDEKNVCQDQKQNTQNNRWLAHCPKDTRSVTQTKFSQTVMVSGCVSCEGDVMSLHFFREGLSSDSEVYVDLLVTVVKPWITMVANGRPHVWKQDSDPCQTSWKRQKWLTANFCDYTSPNVWPSNTPDLNPMD